MTENSVLSTFETLLAGLSLAPAPKSIGVIDPAAVEELPALVLSVEGASRPGDGLGGRSALMTGALAWHAEIDLANPVLPGEPGFSLLSPDRKTLTLPHGGLVTAAGAPGPLTAPDLAVKVKGVSQNLVQGVPGPNSFSADGATGTLTFGTALPPDGKVEADYFLGQWEQRSARCSGVLRLNVLAADAAAVRDLSDGVLQGLGLSGPAKAAGFAQLAVSDIGSIGLAAAPVAAARLRVVRFRFEFELEINQPDSSGGIIRRIPINAFVS
ncbi:MAG: hypothetical protein ABI806_03880 [Candidatus Solibacter sp.]